LCGGGLTDLVSPNSRTPIGVNDIFFCNCQKQQITDPPPFGWSSVCRPGRGTPISRSENFTSLELLQPRKDVKPPVVQGLYSGQMEIWTATNTPKNRDKSGQFKKIPAQAARKLTKSGQNRDRIYKFSTQKVCPDFFTSTLGIYEENLKSGQFPKMRRIRDNYGPAVVLPGSAQLLHKPHQQALYHL
jgi:hypothetical protein